MRFKVGDRWFSVGKGRPLMVEFSEADKRNIAGMDAAATKYAIFREDDPRSVDERLDWME